MSADLEPFTTASGLPLADPSDMPGVHQVFRDALSATAPLVASAQGPERVQLVGGYLDNVLRLLHVHHEGEDDLLTPRLLERLPSRAEVISSVAGEHTAVMPPLLVLETALAAWMAEPTKAKADELTGAVAAVEQTLLPHLDREEREVLPLAAHCLDVAEWGELPQHGMSRFTGDKIWLILGLIREQLTPAKLAEMDAHMPPPVKEFWVTTGQGLFDDYMAAVRGQG